MRPKSDRMSVFDRSIPIFGLRRQFPQYEFCTTPFCALDTEDHFQDSRQQTGHTIRFQVVCICDRSRSGVAADPRIVRLPSSIVNRC
jgi:hypothetical protein